MKKSYNRILKISEDHKMVTLPDSRYYRRHGEYYPSVTYVLSSYPKGKHFEDWLKKVGHSADWIVKKASEEGTKVHSLIEYYLKGVELEYLDGFGNPKMGPHVWQMFLKFVDFWETYKPTLIETEIHLFSDELKIAGTCDLVCEIKLNGNVERWVIDFKTSNQIQTTHELQVALYAKCYEECFGKKIDRIGIMWLKSKSRGHDNTGKKIQGKRWIIHESSRSQEDNLEIYKAVRKIFDLENPKHKPFTESFPIIIQRKS